MALDADTLLDRMQLKQQLMRWRSLSVILLSALALVLIHRSIDMGGIPGADYVARLHVDGIITDDGPRRKLLEELAENDSARAVLVYLDSPGGTALGGEELYLHLTRLAEQKPVVILMRTLCTSACYMAALGGDHIFAREGSITGSIGVIMQAMEFTEMAEMLGVTPIIVRSGPNKAAPNPLDELSPAQRRVIEDVVDEFYAFFTGLVKKERDLPEARLPTITDGRIFTGRQALEAGLIDALGGERDALAWLESEHGIGPDLKVKTVRPQREQDSLFSRLNQFADNALSHAEKLPVALDGLVLIWHPAATP